MSQINLEDLSVEELNRLAVAARKKAAAAKESEKAESLRAEVVEAVKNAPADRLPAILNALKGKKTSGRAVKTAKVKNAYKWDDSIGKNRQVDENGVFVEPPVLMRGRFALTPIR